MSVLNALFSGRRVKAVLKNGHLLALALEDGTEVSIGWADTDGRLIRGEPVLHSVGGRLHARDINQLTLEAMPDKERKGAAGTDELLRQMAAHMAQRHLIPVNYHE